MRKIIDIDGEYFEYLAAVYFRGTSEDDIYVQAVTGLISDMLDRAR